MNLIDPENIVREQSEDPPERGAKSNNSPVAKQSDSQPVDDSSKDAESEQQRNRPIDGGAVNFVDLTKRGATAEDLQKTVQALERQTRVLDTTLSSIVDFAYTFDKEGRFVFANRPLADLLQLTPDEMVGKNFFELGYPEDLAAKLQRQIREVFETKAIVRDETPFTSPAGATGYYEYIFLPVLAGDGTVGAVAGSTRDVTKRKMAEEGLRASEERFRQFAENSADLVWIIDAERQQLEYLSPAFEKMWGESRGAVMHNLVRWSDLVHPDDRETVTKALPRLRAGETVVIDYRIIRPSDGEVRWIRDTGFPIRDQAGEIRRLGGIARDITGERDRGEALRESEERFRVLVEGARDYAMFLLDPSNEITYWSKGAERVFGWSAEEAVGQSGELVFTSEDRAVEQEEKEIEKALRDGSASDRRWHLRKDGSRFWVDGVMRRLDDEKTGALRGFAKVARDASDQRDAEDALRHARDELEQRVLERTAELMTMNNELQSAMNTRRQLERELLEISEREKRRIGEDLHDMVCQELTATALFLKSSAKKLERDSPIAAETLHESAQIVNRNVGIARDLARGLQPAELSASGLNAALRALAAQACEGRDVHCQFNSRRAVRIGDDTVALHLYRIAQEAVTNAVKHSGAENIVISFDRDGDQMCLTIGDDGKGMPKRKRHKGLGLHIMKYRANALGGTLQVESGQRGGTTVTACLPGKS